MAYSNILPESLFMPPSAAGGDSSIPEYVVIRPSKEITFSSELSTSIMEVNIHEGSKFKTGDVLIKLDCRVHKADLSKALSQKKLSEAAIESAKKLKSYNSISHFEYAQAIAQVEVAAADVDKLNAIVEKCTIKAPFAGSVARLMVRSQETVKPGEPLLKIVSIYNLNFQMQVPSNWLKWLRIGTNLSVHVNEIKKNIPVTITRINPEIDSVSQTVRVTGKAIEPDPELLPGMSGQAKFSR